MHAKSIICALAVPALTFGAAIPQDDPYNWDENSSDIVGGEVAAQGDVPFIVSLHQFGEHMCGGTLLNANTVLSAAHCFGFDVASWNVRAGSLNRSSGGVYVNVSSIIKHPNNTEQGTDYDVAIVKLSTPIVLQADSTVGYAALAAPGSDPVDGSIVTVAGWGAVGERAPGSEVLRKVDVPIVSRATCRKNYSVDRISDRMICAGVPAGGKDSCQGDSGGPLFSSTNTVVGVVSWGFGCARPNLPGVYAHVSAFSDFIASNL
ncbi:trypsin-like cysteine/serine peptidase domain-containing protein [Paraphoma chrysanthemicola]|uniref:Trypsin-like cysteine/serine peptidase domain-containing protein n=1 Tax=Paraphoma chrysanthemicola TaxID=798071 RepID=A0A8K0VXJ5_9PLEO|nr:trypsin-like cysteine/serine peptidase domain-containing protein [Paraphoma chrysanthemicola]